MKAGDYALFNNKWCDEVIETFATREQALAAAKGVDQRGKKLFDYGMDFSIAKLGTPKMVFPRVEGMLDYLTDNIAEYAKDGWPPRMTNEEGAALSRLISEMWAAFVKECPRYALDWFSHDDIETFYISRDDGELVKVDDEDV